MPAVKKTPDDEKTSEAIVLGWIKKFPPADAWLSKAKSLGGIEVHHIYGRGRAQSNWQCNLIPIYRAVHNRNHDVGKCAVELCCLRAQWVLQCRHDKECKLKGKASQTGKKKFWNVAAMGALSPYGHTLAGRIEVKLMPIVAGTPLYAMAEELLKECENDDLPF